VQRRDHAGERDIARRMSFYYDPDDQNVDREALNSLSDVQQILRVHPLLMLQAAILAGFGIWLSSGRLRWTLVLLLGTSLLLLFVPSAISTYNARYAVPVGGPIIAAGAIGLWLCLGRLRRTAGEPPGGPRAASGESSA
jgi:hypothetical protein